MEQTKRIAIYARVSTASQEEEQTVQNQLLVLNQEAKKKNYVIVEKYIDEGWSGDLLARPSLDKLRHDARTNKWEAVLIYDPDRLARRYSFQELVMDELREAGKEVLFITLDAPKNSEDKILYGIRGIFAEYERAKIIERFRLGKLRKASLGHMMGGRPLYGYDYVKRDGDTPGHYVINVREAEVVKMMFNWIANEGYTIRRVVKRLADMSIKPKLSKRGVWNPGTVRTLLRHRVYIGEGFYGMRYNVVPQKPIKQEKYRRIKKSSQKKRPKSEWISIPMPAIIDQKLFDKTAKQLEANYHASPTRKKQNYLLTSKIWCTCGKRRCGRSTRQKYAYYVCVNPISTYPLKPTCDSGHVPMHLIDNFVWSNLESIMTSPKLLLEQYDRWRKKEVGDTVQEMEKSAMKEELKNLRATEDRYYRAFGCGVLSLEKLNSYVNPIKESISDLEEKLSTLPENDNQTVYVEINKRKVIEFCKFFREAIKNIDANAKVKITQQVVEKVVCDQESIEISACVPIPNDSADCTHRYNDKDNLQTLLGSDEFKFPINIKRNFK